MKLEELLINKYSQIYKSEIKPNWAVAKKNNKNELVHPSIPFVGNNYSNLKILLYASAENLTYYTEKNEVKEYLDNDLIAINRHRFCFNNCSEKRFFPNVHIEPVNNGALMLIVAYITNILKGEVFEDPFELAENIAIANFGKYSIQSKGKNHDYAGDGGLLLNSIKYIESDLTILKPEIIILPKTIFQKKNVRKMIKDILPNVKIIPIYQITTTTINTHISPKNIKKNKTELPNWLVNWHEKLPVSGSISGRIKDNYYSIYSYLDKIINK